MTENPVPWRKSTYSGSQANCVEVGDFAGHLILVRDTKNRKGTAVDVSPGAWRALVAKVRDFR